MLSFVRWLLSPRYYRRRAYVAKRYGGTWERATASCLYCYFTRDVLKEHGLRLELEPHRCIEGNSPAAVPEARVRK